MISKICIRCNIKKSSDSFGRSSTSKDGLNIYCKKCSRKNDHEYFRRDKARSREVDKSWRKANPDRVKLTKRASIHKKYYGLIPGDFEKTQDFQKHKCAICLNSLERPNIDHNHTTGETRGLLCWHCNNALGKFRDNPELLKRAADYLINPPMRICLNSNRFGLPGRISTAIKRRKMLAIKAVESGLVTAESYNISYPNILEDMKIRKQKKLKKESSEKIIPNASSDSTSNSS